MYRRTGNIKWLILLICCGLSVQCALQPQPRDLAIYVNQEIIDIAELEKIALKRYGELTGDNFVSDQALRASLDAEIIPVYERFTELTLQIKPQTATVRSLHAIYRSAAVLRLRGFRTVMLAIDTQDPDMMRQANRTLDKGQHLVTEWQTRLTAIATQYRLEIN